MLRPILILFLLSLIACQPEPAGNAPARLPINEAPEEASELQLQWGNTRIPLERYASPDIYTGSIQMKVDAFRQMIAQELQLLHKGNTLPISRLHLHRGNARRFETGAERQQLGPEEVASFRKSVQPGDEVYLRLEAENGLRVQAIRIKITDPFEPYQPLVEVSNPQFTEESFGFQVIQETGQRPVLRIDTAAAETQKIYQLYRQNSLYKIIHVPGFRTRRRLLTDRDQIFFTQEIRYATVLSDGPGWKELPEFMEYTGPEVKLQWGDMEALPMSINYNLWDFRANIRQPLRLLVGDQELPIRQLRLSIHGHERYPEMWVADSLSHPELQKRLFRMQGASTAYFSHLIVEVAPDSLMLFPQAFGFNIEARRDYELQLREGGSKGEYRESADGFVFDGQRLSEVLPQLLGLQPGQVHYQHFENDPRLYIAFRSPQYSLEDGRSRVLRQLIDRYRLQLDWDNLPRAYDITLTDRSRLQEYESEGDSARMYQEPHLRQALLLDYPLSSLTELLSKELGYETLNATGLPGSLRLRTEMAFSSVSAARKSLHQIGLGLELSKACARVLIQQRSAALPVE